MVISLTPMPVPETRDQNAPKAREISYEELAALMQKKFRWPGKPHDFQLQATKALLGKRDVLVHAGTGFGKTAIAVGPHAVEEGKITLMVSPLIALHEEQVRRPHIVNITSCS
jgi:superfamily II DNA helicase RecQ